MRRVKRRRKDRPSVMSPTHIFAAVLGAVLIWEAAHADPRSDLAVALSRASRPETATHAFTAETRLAVGSDEEQKTTRAIVRFDPLAAPGARLTVHDLEVNDAAPESADDAEKAEQAVRAMFEDPDNAHLVGLNVGIEETRDVRATTDGFAFGLIPRDELEKAARKLARNVDMSLSVDELCVTRMAMTLRESFKPNVMARVTGFEADGRYMCDGPSGAPRLLEREQRMTIEALGQTIVSSQSVRVLEARKITP